jgi:hypothetical protein
MKDIKEFRKWMDGAYDQICSLEKHPDPSEWHYGEAGRILATASENCRRLGNPELTVLVRCYEDGAGFCFPNEAKDAIAKMLTWCGDYELEKFASHDGPYTVKEAARLLGCSKRHVYDLCKEGKLAHQRPPITITKEKLEDYQRDSQRGNVTQTFRHL